MKKVRGMDRSTCIALESCAACVLGGVLGGERGGRGVNALQACRGSQSAVERARGSVVPKGESRKG